MKLKTLLTALAAVWISGSALAQPAGGMPPVDDTTPVYGSQIMTPQERAEHRDRMRAARTLEEREQIRAEHHERMVERAKERGVTLPDEPPMRGRGMMGPGNQMDPGERQRLGPADRMGPRGASPG
ncbi:hypothetical protein, partial [Aromatoleum aromaticum]